MFQHGILEIVAAQKKFTKKNYPSENRVTLLASYREIYSAPDRWRLSYNFQSLWPKKWL